MLVTTRDASVLTQIGAREKALDVLSDAQAMSLISEWAGIAAGDLPPDAARVAKLCGHLPLALALAGAQVADGVHWATLVEQLAQGKIDFLNHDYGSVFDSREKHRCAHRCGAGRVIWTSRYFPRMLESRREHRSAVAAHRRLERGGSGEAARAIPSQGAAEARAERQRHARELP